ncbi:MAG: hypothetical protein V3R93_04060 [Candidatus Hydrothermarchaeaceae archaeon]
MFGGAGKGDKCNFVRAHQALDGKTPEEVAGIDLGLGERKWNRTYRYRKSK